MAPKKYYTGPTSQQDYNTITGDYFRLPLGGEIEDTSVDADTPTTFQITIPTNAGGDLTVVHQGKGGTLFLLDDDDDTILVGSSSVIYYTVPPGKHGTLFVIALAGDERKVSCTFVQTGVAREAANDKAKPLIPWNFFFWPSSLKFNDQGPTSVTNPLTHTENQMLAKYAHAFGKSVRDTVLWEAEHHQRDEGPAWLGHCHFASAASALFETPTTHTVTVKGKPAESVTFTDEELKFLASEWYGKYGGKDVSPFLLAPSNTFQPWKPALLRPTYNELLKPSEVDLTDDALRAALERAILSYSPALATEGKAKTMAKGAVQPAMRDLVRKAFGSAAARFYNGLTNQLLKLKHPLISDLRSAGRDNGPNEVWNHVIFYYRASFKEIIPTDPNAPSDNYYVEVDIKLVANADVGAPPSSSQPAAPGPNNGIDVDGSFVNRRCRQVLWLVFNPTSGDVADDPRNQWKNCQNALGSEIYAPMYLGVLFPAGTTDATQTPNNDPVVDLGRGNEFVGLDLVTEPNPLLKVRKRYQEMIRGVPLLMFACALGGCRDGQPAGALATEEASDADAGRRPFPLLPEDLEGILPPRWRVGDTWFLRAVVLRQSMFRGLVYVTSIWRFHVIKAPGPGHEYYLVEAKGGHRHMEEGYFLALRLPDYAVLVESSAPTADQIRLARKPELYRSGSAIASAFPQIPPFLDENPPRFANPLREEASLDPSGSPLAAVQTIELMSDGLRITEELPGVSRAVRTVMEWRRGDPWWSSCRMYSRDVDDDDPTHILEETMAIERADLVHPGEDLPEIPVWWPDP